MDKKRFLLYTDWQPLIDSMTDEQAGIILKKIFAYQNGGEYELSDSLLIGIFNLMKERFDTDSEAYRKKCEQNSINGAKGGKAKKANASERVANGSERLASASERVANLADYDYEYDNDYEYEKDNINPLTPLQGEQVSPKKTKKKYGEFQKVALTDEEHEKLIKEYGEETTHRAIVFFDEYIAEKGYKSKSHYLAIRRWVIDAVTKQKQSPPPRGATDWDKIV